VCMLTQVKMKLETIGRIGTSEVKDILRLFRYRRVFRTCL
jgi:hypothetical protein